MPFLDVGPLRIFQFESLQSNGVEHGILTRRGGVSPAPWASLNLGAGVGDESERVQINRRRAVEALGLRPESIYDVWQIHSATVVVVDGPRAEAPPVQADAILTNRPAVTLLMRFADCVPILLVDPRREAIGLVHAGWLGTVRQVLRSAVRRMAESFGSRPEDLRAGLGPSIAGHHYPVGPEVVAAFRQAFGESAEAHLSKDGDRIHLDLWSANVQLLREEGLTQVEVCGLCSACLPQDWFSHRGEHGTTGRFGAALALSA